MQGLWQALLIPAVAVVAALAQGDTPSVRCEDVTKLDVSNQIIRTARRTFAFHYGVAVNNDGPADQWKATIERDSIIRPASDIVVRFLLIHDSHESGSGWRYFATGLRCSNGELVEVFHRDGLSLRVDRFDSTEIQVSLSVIPGQPVRKRWAYVWDLNASRYVLSPK